MADTSNAVRVEGLRALSRAFGKLSKDVRREMTERLRVIARDVALLARQEAIRQGFGKPGTSGRGTGRLVASIRGSVQRGHIALIRDSALNRKSGFSYPRRWEYGDGGARAFMRPAVDESHEAVVAELEEMLGNVLVIDA